ncbi:hypothetical protein [Bacillus pumilus]|nr:hypothetical protein [Bacillus pumilus]
MNEVEEVWEGVEGLRMKKGGDKGGEKRVEFVRKWRGGEGEVKEMV